MWTEEAMEGPEERIKAFKKILVDALDKYCNSGLYTPGTIHLTSWWKIYGTLKLRLFFTLFHMSTFIGTSSVIIDGPSIVDNHG